MSESTNAGLIRTTTRIAFLVALTTLIAVPAIYLTTALAYEHGRLHTEATFHAARIAKLVYVRPVHWTFEQSRLNELLSYDTGQMNGANRRVVALDGRVIASVGEPPGFLSMKGEAPVHDGQGIVASVYVDESIWPLVSATGLVALIGIVLSLAVYIALKTLPLRALERVVAELERRTKSLAKSNRNLESEISDRQVAQTALLKSEQRFKDFANTSSDWFWELDDRLRFSYFSNNMTNVTGMEAGAILGKTKRELNCTEVDKQVWERHLADLEAHKPFRGFTYKSKHPDGRVVHLSTNGDPVFGPDGRFLGYRGTGMDITDLHDAEAALRQSQKVESIGTLSGGIAHEINNMLVPVVGLAGLTRDRLPEGSADRRNLDRVLTAADRIRDLVAKILAFSRTQQSERRPEPFAKLIEDGLDLMRSTLPATVAIRANIDGDTGSVVCSPTEIDQIILNLGTNAVNAMNGRGELEVTVDRVEITAEQAARLPALSPGPHIRLVFRDTGCGMDAATAGRIFDPFFTTKDVGEGTGLGLSVVYGIVTDLGGHIEVASEPEKGATFRLHFPAWDGPAVAGKPTPPRDRERSGPGAARGTDGDPAKPESGAPAGRQAKAGPRLAPAG